MASRKLNTEGIDENLLLASIGKSRQMAGASPPPQPDGTGSAWETPANAGQPSKMKGQYEQVKGKSRDYGQTFLKGHELKTRKCVYISAEAHGIVSKIVNTIADKEITVGGYIDTVLMRHFEENKEEINSLYRRDRDDLI